MIIYKYEIELKVTHKATGESSLVTRTDHAYNITDVCMQSIYAVMKDRGPNVELTVMRVGPPLVDIQNQEQQINDAIHKRLAELGATSSGRS